MEFQLHVALAEGEQDGDDGPWAGLLSDELGEFDEVQVGRAPADPVEGAKGLAAGALLARIPGGTAKAVLGMVRAWVVRTGRTVEATIDGDTIRITGASGDQQDRVIEAWLARHSAGA
jgi:hypothetical protein